MTSLHTQYRPDTFDKVVGHPEVIKSLKKVVADKRAKSFIFTGPAGTGKTTLARILAYEFAGKQRSHANIQEIAAADHTGVDDMRKLADSALYRAIGGSPVKAFIIDEAHRLSGAAWDVLLKPIEEPPAHVYWMFCTTNAGKIPKTIQTRCLKYDLRPVSEEAIILILLRVAQAEKIEISDDIIEAIAEDSGGSPRQALVYLEACLYCETVAEARQAMRSAGQSREAIDLCRFITQPRGRTWAEAMKILKGLEGAEAESVRIVLVNYIAAALLNTKDDKRAAQFLGLLECFNTPYNQSDKFAPLLLSVGMALDLDQ